MANHNAGERIRGNAELRLRPIFGFVEISDAALRTIDSTQQKSVNKTALQPEDRRVALDRTCGYHYHHHIFCSLP